MVIGNALIHTLLEQGGEVAKFLETGFKVLSKAVKNGCLGFLKLMLFTLLMHGVNEKKQTKVLVLAGHPAPHLPDKANRSHKPDHP